MSDPNRVALRQLFETLMDVVSRYEKIQNPNQDEIKIKEMAMSLISHFLQEMEPILAPGGWQTQPPQQE